MLLRHSDSPEGTPPANEPQDPQNPQAGPPQDPTPSAPAASPPAAAKIVLEGTKNERELSLEREAKRLQTRLSELEDENRVLKTPASPRTTVPDQEKKSWLDGATFFED